ncbi:hypothetical protein [Desulfosporosinus sp. SB140]|uniref:hypothetical protein n=1 Tax=Desulfosporosinus paludis TaxID=3115649 RepID=UPI00388D797E
MIDKTKIKLFKMNDYDWVAAESKEQAQEGYLKEHGITEEENLFEDIKEEPLSKSFLCPVSELTPEEKTMNFVITERHGQKWVWLPFSYTLTTIGDLETPSMAETTEC